MNRTHLLVGAGALLVCSTAFAATETFTGTVTGAGGNWSAQALVPRFDEQGGARVLEQVVFDIVGEVGVDAGIENRDATPVTVDLNLFGSFEVLGDGETIASAEPTLIDTFEIGAFDQTLDFAGPSGLTIEDMTTSLTDTTVNLSPAIDLSEWIGQSPRALDVHTKSSSFITGGGNLTALLRTEASLQWSVTYVYRGAEMIPLPHAAGLGVFGLLVVCARRRR